MKRIFEILLEFHSLSVNNRQIIGGGDLSPALIPTYNSRLISEKTLQAASGEVACYARDNVDFSVAD